MASTDYTNARTAPASGLLGLLKGKKDRAIVGLVFMVAFGFHLAALFNLLPA